MGLLKIFVFSYDIISCNFVIFKSWDYDCWYFKVLFWEICFFFVLVLIYFLVYCIKYDGWVYLLIDGGVCVNNFVVCVVVEVIKLLC